MTPDLFMVAGEVSGDILGGSILESLLKDRKDLDVVGIGGKQMRANGLFPTIPMEELQVMGFIDVLKHLPRLYKIFRSTVQTILHLNPKVVVTIDYPGFNLRLAKALRNKGYKGKICHVVCPSVWAWGKKRIQTLAKYDDLLLTLLPFEKPLFKKTTLRVEFIGHPLVKKVAYEHYPEENLVAIFPGSRSHEIERNLPYFLRLIPKLYSARSEIVNLEDTKVPGLDDRQSIHISNIDRLTIIQSRELSLSSKSQFQSGRSIDPKLKFVISVSQEKYRPLIQKMAGPSISLLAPAEMNQIKPMLALAKCGTIALELALRGIPTVVTYKISPLDVFLAKWVFRINLPYYSLPNLILNRPLFPELIGPQLTDKNLFDAATALLDPKKRHACHLACKEVRELLTSEQDAGALIRTLL